MPLKHFAAVAVAAGMGLMALAPQARAGTVYTVTISQAGRDVLFSGSGNFDLTNGAASYINEIDPSSINSAGLIIVGTAAPGNYYQWFDGSWSGVIPFSPRIARGLLGEAGVPEGFNIEESTVFVPVGYVSGDELSGSALASGQTIDSMGYTPGDYTFTYGPSGADTIEINVVPEPASLALLGLFAGCAVMVRRRCRVGASGTPLTV